MSNFKIGDKVRYVNSRWPYNSTELMVGATYIVKRSDGFGFVYLNNNWFAEDCFELVESFQKPVDLPEYVIVQGKAQDVVAEVEQYLKQGYKPQGGVSMHQDWFAQAMILGD